MREVDEKSIVVRILFKTMFYVSKFFRNVLHINVGRVLFGTVHKKFGGSFRFFVSGGAAISVELLKNFDYLGFPIIQGYGLTESSPIIAANTLTDNKFGSVGHPIPDVKVKIINGEIVATGPNIMKGYFKMKEETDKILKDGWLYTGDVGFLDSRGYLYITGRYKDVIIASNGVNVYPDEIEFELNKVPYIKESCVIGRKIVQGIKKGSEEVFAVIIPNIEYFTKLGLSTEGDAVHSAIADATEKLNDRLSLYKRISAFSIRNSDFPKTSTRKIKRFAVKKEMEEIWKI
jgi:long-chain acyl-CoA synthetase